MVLNLGNDYVRAEAVAFLLQHQRQSGKEYKMKVWTFGSVLFVCKMFCSSFKYKRPTKYHFISDVHVGQQFAHSLATLFQSIFLYALLISVKQLQLFMHNPFSMHPDAIMYNPCT